MNVLRAAPDLNLHIRLKEMQLISFDDTIVGKHSSERQDYDYESESQVH